MQVGIDLSEYTVQSLGNSDHICICLEPIPSGGNTSTQAAMSAVGLDETVVMSDNSVEEPMTPGMAVATSVVEGAINPSTVAPASAEAKAKSNVSTKITEDDDTIKGSTVIASSPPSPQAAPSPQFAPPASSGNTATMGTYSPILRKKTPKMSSFPCAVRKSEYTFFILNTSKFLETLRLNLNYFFDSILLEF